MIQKIYKFLGDGGCYFLSLLKAAEGITGKRIDPVVAYAECVQAGFMTADCFLEFPHRVLEAYTGNVYEVFKAPISYIALDGEVEVLRFERPTTAQLYSHFVLGNGEGRVEYDPLGDSQTVKQGKLASKRIFRRVI